MLESYYHFVICVFTWLVEYVFPYLGLAVAIIWTGWCINSARKLSPKWGVYATIIVLFMIWSLGFATHYDTQHEFKLSKECRNAH